MPVTSSQDALLCNCQRVLTCDVGPKAAFPNVWRHHPTTMPDGSELIWHYPQVVACCSLRG